MMVNHVLPFCRFDQFGAGALLALLVREKPLQARHLYRHAPLAMVVGLGAIILSEVFKRYGPDHIAAIDNVEYSFSALFFSSLILRALFTRPGSFWHKLTCTPFLTTLGKYSYALYLFHFPLWIFLSGYAQTHLSQIAWLQSDSFSLCFLKGSFVGLLSFGIAKLSWRYWESPFLKLKERYAYQDQSLKTAWPEKEPGVFLEKKAA